MKETTYKFLPVVFLGTLNSQLTICKYNAAGQFIAGQAGCYNLAPVFDWIHRCIISIFLVFMIAFLPLFLQGKQAFALHCS
jgi:1,3-beta-glucan synthase